MERKGTPILPDWIVLTARWIFLIAVSIWMIFQGGPEWPVLAVILLGVLGNIIATGFVVFNRTGRGFQWSCIAGDLLFAGILFYTGIITDTTLTWTGFMPLITLSFFFQWRGAIAGILFIGLLQGSLAYWLGSYDEALLLVGIMLPANILIGLGLAFLSSRLAVGLGWPKKTTLRKPVNRKELERRQTLYDLISELSATLNYQKVLETSLDMGSTALAELGAQTDKLSSAVMLFTDNNPSTPELMVATARRFIASDRNVTLPGRRGALAQVIESGNAVLVKEPKADPEIKQIIALHECRSAYLLPLRTGLDAYGLLLFAHHDPDFFTNERREVLEIVRNQSTIAIQNARLYQALEEEKNRMVEVQEESRKKLSRDLHDGPTQSISAIAMRVNFARRLMERDPKSASEELFKIEELARRTTKEIRHMLFTLRPLVLESQGLIAALESMSDKMRETYDQEVMVQVDQRVIDLLEPGKQGVIFYIVEEAVNNARKHAQADQIWVRLRLLREGLGLLEIEDNGVGFDTEEVDASYDSRGSLGMINLRERTELVSGALRIESAKGKGTLVQVVIPLTEEAADRIRRGN